MAYQIRLQEQKEICKHDICEKRQFRIFRSIIPAYILKVSFEWVQLQHNTVVMIR
jgi:hypothetical protein